MFLEKKEIMMWKFQHLSVEWNILTRLRQSKGKINFGFCSTVEKVICDGDGWRMGERKGLLNRRMSTVFLEKRNYRWLIRQESVPDLILVQIPYYSVKEKKESLMMGISVCWSPNSHEKYWQSGKAGRLRYCTVLAQCCTASPQTYHPKSAKSDPPKKPQKGSKQANKINHKPTILLGR